MFGDLPAAPPDPILGLADLYRADPNPDKVNLGIGVYQDEAGRTPVLDCVREAERRLPELNLSKSYLPIGGSDDVVARLREMALGAQGVAAAGGRARSVQTPGGTGALRVGADVLKRFFPEAGVWISRPTWPNHRGLFAAAGFAVREYPYYDTDRRALAFDAMCAALRAVPAGDVVVLHVCCHNPTGMDLSEEQWRVVADIGAERGWLPFLDFAYQGFGRGVDEDRIAVSVCMERMPDLLIAGSLSKNFGLYNERVGALTLVAADAPAADRALSQVRSAIRVLYSNPPAHGAHLVRVILGDPDLTRLWRRELDGMRARLAAMRKALARGLTERGAPGDHDYLTAGSGLFALTGWSEERIRRLREERSIYIVSGGRINVAGISPANLDCLCDAVTEALG